MKANQESPILKNLEDCGGPKSKQSVSDDVGKHLSDTPSRESPIPGTGTPWSGEKGGCSTSVFRL